MKRMTDERLRFWERAYPAAGELFQEVRRARRGEIEGVKLNISKTFDFDAAHRLPLVPESHKCARLHGHTYRVELVLAGEPDERGFVADYAEIAAAWEPIHAQIDHRYLNEIQGLENPTTEALARWLFERLLVPLPLLVRLRVYESSTTWCEVSL